MRRAILSDIHGNLHALEAVLKDAEKAVVEEFLCLGDVVGYGAYPQECLQLVRERCRWVVRGNHDQVASDDSPLDEYYNEARISLEWTRKMLSTEDRAWLGSLPMVVQEESLSLVHASLHRPEDWEYLDFEGDLRRHFRCQETPICFSGHTHVAGVFEEEPLASREIPWNAPYSLSPEKRYLLNAGSVGQPRDQDPRASYVILDEFQKVVTFRRVRYEVGRAQTAIRARKLPPFLAERLGEGV